MLILSLIASVLRCEIGVSKFDPSHLSQPVCFGDYYRFGRERSANGGVLETLPVSNVQLQKFWGVISQESPVNSKKIPVFRDAVWRLSSISTERQLGSDCPIGLPIVVSWFGNARTSI